MAIKAKFYCESILDNGRQKTATLRAAMGTAGENADYAKFTPAGNLTITIDNETAASDFFRPNYAYYLTLEDATPVVTEA